MTGVANIEAPNTRLAKMKAFVAKPPTGATRLVVFALQGEGNRFKVYEGEAPFAPMQALDAERLMSEYLDDVEERECKFQMSFVSETGKLVGAPKLINYRRESADAAAEVQGQFFDGTGAASEVQRQRHHEAMMRMYLAAQQQLFSSLLAQNERLATRVVEADREVVRTREELHQARVQELDDALRQLPSQTEGQEGQQQSAGQEKLLQLLQMVLVRAMHQTPSTPQGSGGGTEG